MPCVLRDDILRLIPHQGGMCLWDEVTAWSDARIALRAWNHRHPAHPLRHAGRLHAVHLCEYGAQAMAVHGGLLARAAGGAAPPGLLVALRGVRLHCGRIDDLADALTCEAEALVRSEGGSQYAFRIAHCDTPLAEGRAAVLFAPDAGA